MIKVKVEKLQKSFGSLEVLKGIDLEVKEGEVVCLIGPSGSGKSTFLRCLNRLEETTAGTVIVDDNDITDPKCNINKVRENIGMVFQQFNLFPHLSVLENIMLAPVDRKKLTKAEAKQTAERLLATVGLAEKAGEYPPNLSGGQQQRVAIARALMQQAKVILADEPIASLDPESARIVMETLRDINQNDGITVVVTLHQVDYALRYCERIVALRQGHVFYDGSSQQFDNERFDHLYRSINRIEENAKAA